MVTSGILRKHHGWNNAVELKLKHLDSLSDFSKQIFFSFITLFGAIFISIITLSSPIISKIGVFYFFIAIVLLFTLFLFIANGLARNVVYGINDFYNKLFYEILAGRIKSIQPLSNEEYKELVEKI